MFIVFEGIDGSGKGTQARMLADLLIRQGRRVVLTEEPTRELFTGYFVRMLLRSKEEPDPKTVAMLMAADRNEHVRKVIEPALRAGAGEVVISERYYWSSLAYQGAQGVDESFIKALNEGFPKPDVTVLIDLPVDEALERIRARAHGNEGLVQLFERREFLERVQERYRRLAEEHGFVVVDGGEGQLRSIKEFWAPSAVRSCSSGSPHQSSRF